MENNQIPSPKKTWYREFFEWGYKKWWVWAIALIIVMMIYNFISNTISNISYSLRPTVTFTTEDSLGGRTADSYPLGVFDTQIVERSTGSFLRGSIRKNSSTPTQSYVLLDIELYSRTGDPVASRHIFSLYAISTGDVYRFETHLSAGAAQFRIIDLEEICFELRTAERLHLMLSNAEFNIENENFDSARRQLDEAFDIDPNSEHIANLRQRLEEAEEIARYSLEYSPVAEEFEITPPENPPVAEEFEITPPENPPVEEQHIYDTDTIANIYALGDDAIVDVGVGTNELAGMLLVGEDTQLRLRVTNVLYGDDARQQLWAWQRSRTPDDQRVSLPPLPANQQWVVVEMRAYNLGNREVALDHSNFRLNGNLSQNRFFPRYMPRLFDYTSVVPTGEPMNFMSGAIAFSISRHSFSNLEMTLIDSRYALGWEDNVEPIAIFNVSR